MADAKVLEFLQQVERDAELRVRVQGLPLENKRVALDELARIAQTAGYDLSPAQLEIGLRECTPEELSDSALDGVVGGVGDTGVSPTHPTYPTFQNTPTLAALQSKLKKSGVSPCW